MKQTFHISCSIEGLLRRREKLDFLQHDDGRYMTDKEARQELRYLQAMGHKFTKSGGCDNFDPQKGCLGHVQEDDTKEDEG